MKTLMIIIALMLTGCTTMYGEVYTQNSRVGVAVSEVVSTVPVIIGTHTSAIIFGGQVAYNPHPLYYVSNQVNWQSRYVYNTSRRYVRERATPQFRHRHYDYQQHNHRQHR